MVKVSSILLDLTPLRSAVALGASGARMGRGSYAQQARWLLQRRYVALVLFFGQGRLRSAGRCTPEGSMPKVARYPLGFSPF